MAQLDHIVGMYNAVLTELLPVEEPLLEDRIAKMDQAGRMAKMDALPNVSFSMPCLELGRHWVNMYHQLLWVCHFGSRLSQIGRHLFGFRLYC